ncbi:MAG: bifunctional 4-hydroxy-2-oxoglutarate aldolase/2-dehydro-3-deoxy-phosphogluconate aldolase [Clostridia bacterium]|nr:bifunctional 4-hydroxy-2-oxoglutarate aldolase/2-dehydro-3-deoxy-phosphogluconate aldolase [Clostridia bacterium]
MNDVIKQLSLIGVVPVIKIDNAADAVPLAKALIDGGLPCAEVTFRTAAAKDAIAAISKAYPDMIVGAGTVLTKQQVDDAIEAGSKFIVSPGFNPEIVAYCQEKGCPIVPGINNPSGIEQALGLGLDVVKFFPTEQSGGLEMIKAMSAPYGAVKFMPTGGVNPANVCDYLDNPKIICCGGSWMVKADMIAAGDFDGITKLVRQAVDTVLGFKFRHIGMNNADANTAEAGADLFGKMFSFAKDARSASFFAGPSFEFMNSKGPGAMGHIAIETNSVDRAVYHLGRRGVEFNYDTAQYTPAGALKFIYLKDEVCGFAIHLMLK